MKINICGIGNPHNPKVWSGTPYNILKVLEANDNLASAFSSDENTLLSRFLKFTGALYYNVKPGWERRSRTVRQINAATSVKNTRRSVSNHTLHFGTGDLPFRKLPKGQYHYIYCDSTWDLWSTHSTFRHLYSKRIIKLCEELEQLSFAQATHIFPISEYVKENLINHYHVNPSKITVVGTGPGVIKPFFGQKDYRQKKILFAAKGRFEDKGGFIVLDAFKKALREHPDMHLSIVGQKKYQQMASHPNITAYDFLSIGQLQELFNSHSLFLMPAINEPWGLVYIEAMLCKMPIVGLNRNSFPELSHYGKFGVGIDSPDAERLAGVLSNLMSDTGRLTAMGAGAQSFALQQFTWRNTVQKIIDQITLIDKNGEAPAN
ncbi:glycosyltransferase [Paraflavitalea soli]|uniref:Glycosyltransferase n=1 Tax=Paraflavitalea soli TaxID=2315862 RepID=A0A3B7MJE4_9BACT|nr:glycosyltransferase family 4 protein [Paraflavitalea soli]AXY74552.1 glycosyltransferase [Paraflavitalea soli]